MLVLEQTGVVTRLSKDIVRWGKPQTLPKGQEAGEVEQQNCERGVQDQAENISPNGVPVTSEEHGERVLESEAVNESDIETRTLRPNASIFETAKSNQSDEINEMICQEVLSLEPVRTSKS